MYNSVDIIRTRRVHERGVKEMPHLPRNLTKSPQHLFVHSIMHYLSESVKLWKSHMYCTNCWNLDVGCWIFSSIDLKLQINKRSTHKSLKKMVPTTIAGRKTTTQRSQSHMHVLRPFFMFDT